MVKKFNRQGVSVFSEYVITFFLVITVAVAMTVYIQRTLQGRMRDARNYMIEKVSKECDQNCMEATDLKGKTTIGQQYEPYYVKANSVVDTNSLSHTGLLSPGVGSTGIFIGRTNAQVLTNTQSDQLPPKEAEQDKVLGSR